ncbi:ATP-binding protein [Streptomyces sp. NBC_00103]|uniref:ATP-binding protein n=1 Tax=Streptomyces sp. NBC_00103 TaxID=2975653 RepID=UPI00225A1A8A|nr:ATP-binding protein [Streptomyces sp. NBC_00103]MCX5369657.1 ATP-binding protein [Streptomyces sp. NBC_00103]
MTRKPWDLAFTAEPTEVAALRRIMRLHLGIWGLAEVIDDAQLCMSELVSNVITHVGPGTPATLAVSMNGVRLRIEVHDPDARALPTLLDAKVESESGRGMALVDAIADRWGVQLHADQKVTWCELGTGLSAADGLCMSPRVARAEKVSAVYDMTPCSSANGSSRLQAAAAESMVVDAIANLLHWLRAHGHDADEALDQAQMRFEADLPSGTPRRDALPGCDR